MKKVWITSDCTCDLSEELLEQYNLEVIYFYITTDHGCFRDLDEMTSTNVVEYFQDGGQRISTTAPEVYEYVDFFERMLQKYDEIVHVAISSELSLSYSNAVNASKKFNGRVKVFDSGHLSTGIAHLVLRAMEMANENKTGDQILAELDLMKNKVSTSFIAENADYLHRTGRVSKFVKDFCFTFKIHPVLGMKDGKMKMKTVYIGEYEKCVIKYVRKELKKSSNIKKERLFITYSTCPVKLLTRVKAQIEECCSFKQIWETKASATITSNCGANTIGVLFVNE